ncbi:S26 family signal peptidase [Mesorhizobium amorphae]|uniref:S26 family signal peptidase n=1 Tax=Mesorhizobium amorphae TaxID=71433 RepID=UPI0011841835|nr:S26 family signal peptidase [Mesorhizobium amorphae]
MNMRPSIHVLGERLRRIRARKLIAVTATGLSLLAFGAVIKPSPRLVWNVSASAPIGLYRVVSGTPLRGDLVVAHPPKFIAGLAAERGYLPTSVPLVKRVAALPREHVCAFYEAIIIGGEIVARRLRTDRQGRQLPWWNGCRALGPEEFFLLGVDSANSFDSRYFGPVPVKNIIGRVVPLWTE